MLKITLLMCALSTLANGQDKPTTVAGEWILTLEGHQVGLALEQDGQTLTGRLLIMGKDVPVEGQFVDGTLTLTGPAAIGGHDGGGTVPLKLTGTLKDNGTLEGEISGAHAPLRWTGERFKPQGEGL